jgi:hypothetical protein
MGTRADFYIGEGPDAEWLGSIAWDGYPSGIDGDVLRSTSPAVFRANVERFLASRKDGTMPEMGWPWPWDDSNTTDYAYALRDGAVYGSCFGHPWFLASEEEPEQDDPNGTRPSFPDMKARKAVTYGKRSGVIVMTSRGLRED